MQDTWPQNYIPNYDEYIKISDIVKATTLLHNPQYSRNNKGFNFSEWMIELETILNAPSYTIEELNTRASLIQGIE